MIIYPVVIYVVVSLTCVVSSCGVFFFSSRRRHTISGQVDEGKRGECAIGVKKRECPMVYCDSFFFQKLLQRAAWASIQSYKKLYLNLLATASSCLRKVIKI